MVIAFVILILQDQSESSSSCEVRLKGVHGVLVLEHRIQRACLSLAVPGVTDAVEKWLSEMCGAGFPAAPLRVGGKWPTRGDGS